MLPRGNFTHILAHLESVGIPRPTFLPAGSLVVEWNQQLNIPNEPVRVKSVATVFVCTRCWALVVTEALVLHDETHKPESP